MYVSSRYENSSSVNIKIPWDSNTARGFIIALILTALCLLIAPYVDPRPKPRELQIATIPLTLLNFGDGDGTGISKGNLTKEGTSHLGAKPNSALEDARIAADTKSGKPSEADIMTSTNLIASSELSSDQKNKDGTSGSDSRNTGSPDGSQSGTGLGDKGTGKGKGSGFGDIEWGGGGNRTVLYKKIPTFPEGVNTSAQIKMKFTVQPDGTVSNVFPMQKADPILERAAIDALKQWRFNPLKDDIVMVGIIPMTFMLR